ncbi:MAG: FMN-binding protein [Acidobacteria bacterium]|nr:MAG: FMN-binding protein [Acidobacteriota bacterium]
MSGESVSPVRLVGTLAVAGLLSGIVLVSVYLWAAPRIATNRADALRAAVLRALPGSVSSRPLVVREGRLVPYEGPEGTLPEEEAVYAGYDAQGRLVGYAVPAAGPGFMDTIALIYGLDPDRRVIVGMEVLDSRETPGLGDRIVSDPDFHANFRALAVEPAIVPVKKGEKSAPNEVDCITGATISSEAVVSIINRSLETWKDRLLTGAAEEGAAEAQ